MSSNADIYHEMIIDYSRNQRIDIKPELLDLQWEVNDALSELKYLGYHKKTEFLLF